MSDDKSDDKSSNNDRGGIITFGSGFWLLAWMFTIGYANLSFPRGVLALLIWPYDLGVAAHG